MKTESIDKKAALEETSLKKTYSSSLCLCITTYKRWKVIKDFLDNCASYYLDAGIDIYIYDSSDDSETKRVLEEWWDKNQERVYYIHMPTELHANMKVYKIWQFYGFKSQYDFVWMSGDSFQLSKRAVEIVMSNLKSNYDMIELDVFDRGDIGCKLYTQPNELFVEDAYKLTMFGTVILNTHTILSDVDWKYYETRYSQPKLINYSHVSFCFNRAAELNDFQCLHLPLANEFKLSEYKTVSGWKRETFSVICDGWVTTIKEMPSVYSDRKKVTLDLGIKAILRDAYMFCELKYEGVYNIHVFLKYFWAWRKVCNVSYWELLIIASFPGETVKLFLNRKASGKLRKFARKYKFLYLYGAGIVGERWGQYLLQNGIDYAGYVVTRISENKTMINNHSVIELDELERNGDIGIIVSVSERLSGEVMEKLWEYGYGKQVYYCGDVNRWIKILMKKR